MRSKETSITLPDKLLKPNIIGVLSRHRLYELLDSAGQNHRLIWVQAPAGSGKTTLAATYAEQSNLATLWYRFDEDDSDPAKFFQHFLTAAQHTFGTGTSAAHFSPGFLNNLAAFARQFFGSVFLGDTMRRLIVLDDFQAIQQHDYLNRIMDTLFQVCPANIRILIFSRHHPPAYCLNLLYNELTIVPAQVLSFNSIETNQLLNSKAIYLSEQQITDLLKETHGWAAALNIVSSRTETDPTTQNIQLRDLAHQLWQGLSDQYQQQLLCLALPQTITVNVAMELTGDDQVGASLFHLAHEQYLLSRIDTEPPTFKLHPLLREAILEHLQSHQESDKFHSRIVKVASVLERHHLVHEAIPLYIQANDTPKAVRLIIQQAKTELAAGRAVTVLNWLDRIPESEFTNPWLTYWKAAATLPMHPRQAQSLFEQAHHAFGSDPLGRLLSSAGVITAMYFAWDEFTQAPVWIDELAELDDFRASLNDPELDTWVLGCGNMLVNLDTDQVLLHRWVRHAEDMLQHKTTPDQFFLVNFLLQTRIWQGNLPGCRELLQRLSPDQANETPLLKITLLIWQAVSAFLEADHQQAYQAVEQARHLAQSYDLRFLLPQIYGQEIYTALSCHDLERAAKALDNMQASLLPDRRQDQGFYLHVKSCWLLLQGDLDQAQKVAETTLQISRDTGVASSACLVEHVLAQILIAQCDWGRANPRLDRIADYCRKNGFHYIELMLQLTRADGMLTTFDEAAAAAVLKNAFALGRTYRYLNAHPQWQPKVISRLCSLALERNIEPDYVRLLIRERQLPPGNDANESWPWPVKIRTLGSFRVDAAEQPVHPGKKDNKPLLLLQLLITLNPDGVPRQVLADQIWPDADADTALHALEVNLQRLRKMLGRADAIILSGGNLYLNRNRCWLDVWTLDDLTRRLDRRLIPAETALQRLLPIWRGPFLPGQNTADIEAKRLLLSAKFVRMMTQIGQTLIDENKPESAIEAFRRAIEVEPLAEQLHYQLIKTLLDQGRPLEALAAYRLYESIHRSHWGDHPSDTLKSCQSLLKKS
jgi:LuxR family maltose regulon positive regulatory protein